MASEVSISGALVGAVVIVALIYMIYRHGVKKDWWDGF